MSDHDSKSSLQTWGTDVGQVNLGYVSGDDSGGSKVNFDEDENKDRGNWSGKLDFIMACLSCAVGLGNVWRFPYLAYKNGGGAFFIPYVIMMVFVGLPVFFLELSVGQFASSGPLTCFRYSPIFSGIGIGMVLAGALISMYYNVIISWAVYYLIRSFTDIPSLPWANCNHDWATWLCEDRLPDVPCNTNDTIRNNTGICINTTADAVAGIWDEELARNNSIVRQSATQQFFDYRFFNLKKSTSISDIGDLRWELCVCLLGAWIIVFFCLVKGIKSSGKVVYFTALFPYAVLLALFINGMTLEGMEQGIKFYVTPKWELLGNAKVWNDAAVQIFFSLSIGVGGLMTLASYNRFNTNTLRDSFVVVIGNCLTSVFAGFVIFAYLGHMAHKLDTTVDKVAAGSVGLAFVVYPQSVMTLPFPPIWSVLFFLMLLTLGFGSQFALVETVTTALQDRFPQLRPKKAFVVLTVCVLFCLVGLSMCTDGGVYVLTLFDSYSGSWGLLVLGIFECVSIGWVYGFSRFRKDIKIMIGFDPTIWWAICWAALSPAVLGFILIFGWVDFQPLKYGGDYMPPWTNFVGMTLVILVAIATPVMGVYRVMRNRGSLWMKLCTACKPKWNWGPAMEMHRRLVTYVPNFVYDIHNPEERLKHEESTWDLEGLHYTRGEPKVPAPVVLQSAYSANGQENKSFDCKE